MIWTDDTRATLKRMWESGEGATTIASYFASQGYTCTRNSVVGACYRSGFKSPNISGGASVTQATEARKRMASERQRLARINAIKRNGGTPFKPSYRAPLPVQPVAATEPMHLKLMELEQFSCRYPYGGIYREVPVTFCGHRKMDDRPYCAAHMSITHYRAART